MIKVHFLYVLGYLNKAALALKMYEYLCMRIDKKKVIKEFWDKFSYKLRDIPKGAVVTSFLPKYLIEPVVKNNRLLALEPFFNNISLKKDMVKRVFGDIKINTYYYGNIIDDSLMKIAKNVINPDGSVFVKHKKSIKRTFFVREFLMYVIIGAVNTLCGVTSASLLSYLFPPMISFSLGYAIFLVFSYLLNTKFTFRDTYSFPKFLKFCVAYVPSFIIQFLFAGTLISAFGDANFWIYFLTVLAGIPATFVIMRFFTFAKGKIKKKI